MVALLLVGFVLGVLTVLIAQYILYFNPFAEPVPNAAPPSAFSPPRIPTELKNLLTDSTKLKKKENCVAFNFLLHFLYQEVKDTRGFRRWLLRKLQLEFNELLCRSGVGKLLKDIRIRELDVGTQVPVLRDIHVEDVTVSDDGERFEELDCMLTVDYRGGFHISVDVDAVVGRKAALSVHMTRLQGQMRIKMTRHPYTHWVMAFTTKPYIELKIDSKFDGRPIPQLVPLIIQQFHRAIRKKHVFPNYKLRYKPFFINHLLQPSPDPKYFEHIPLKGVLLLTVQSCSRLNLNGILEDQAFFGLYVNVSIGPKPYFDGAADLNYVTLLIKMIGHNTSNENLGLILSKTVIREKAGQRFVCVASILRDSPAEKYGFRVGDTILAINNLSIISEKQALKMMNDAAFEELSVLVERKLVNVDDDAWEQIVDATKATQNIDILAPSENLLTPGGLTKANSENNLLTAINTRSSKSESCENMVFGLESALVMPENKLALCNKRSLSYLDISQTDALQIPLPKRESLPAFAKKMSVDSISSSADETKIETPTSSQSILQNLPADSKRRKIATKASETAVNLSQRLKTGTATVRGMWNTYQESRKSVGEGTEQATEPINIETISCDLATKNEQQSVASPQVDAPEVKPGENINEHSEIVVTDEKQKLGPETEIESENGEKLGGDLKRIRSDSTNSKKADELVKKETRMVNVKKDPVFDQSFDFLLCPQTKYVSFSVWAKNKVEVQEPVLLGQTCMLVSQVLDDCSCTLSRFNQITVPLKPVGTVLAPPGPYSNLTEHKGFDGRLCYGDITVSCMWSPDATHTSIEDRLDEDEPLLLDVAPTEACIHKWLPCQFSGQSVFCASCHKKIWLKVAVQCSTCAAICHKKCQANANKTLGCNAASGADGEKGENEHEMSLPSTPVNVAKPTTPVCMTEPSKKVAKKLPFNLTEKVQSTLRRRKVAEIKSEEQKMAPIAPSLDVSHFEDSELVELFQQTGGHSLLYTEGGIYNEKVICAAKTLGKDLFSNLPLQERKEKINAQIDKLQKEIDCETMKRLKMLEHNDHTAQADFEKDLSKLDDKIQALAVLMLHFCAGLQQCIDLEEQEQTQKLEQVDALADAVTDAVIDVVTDTVTDDVTVNVSDKSDGDDNCNGGFDAAVLQVVDGTLMEDIGPGSNTPGQMDVQNVHTNAGENSLQWKVADQNEWTLGNCSEDERTIGDKNQKPNLEIFEDKKVLYKLKDRCEVDE